MMIFLYVFIICLCVYSGTSDENNHIYNEGDEVVLWMKSVGPYHNKEKTYPYFSLPFCAGSVRPRSQHYPTFNEQPQGGKLQYSGYETYFKVNVSPTVICLIQLRDDMIKAFSFAVRNEYWYQMYIDGLLIGGEVGEHSESDNKFYIYTHRKFDIGYNGKRIVEINITAEKKQLLVTDAKIPFTYEINWKLSQKKFENRLDVNPSQRKFPIFEDVAIVLSSFVIVLLVIVMIIVIRRHLVQQRRVNEKDFFIKMLPK